MPKEDAYAPRWAKEKIARLEADLEHWKEQYHALLVPGVDGSNTYLDTGDGPVALGRDVRILFLREGETNRCTFEVRYDSRSEVLTIHGTDTVNVLPRAANALMIEPRPRMAVNP